MLQSCRGFKVIEILEEYGEFCQIRSFKGVAKLLDFSKTKGENSHGQVIQVISTPPFLDTWTFDELEMLLIPNALC